jgi:hypothetical protein
MSEIIFIENKTQPKYLKGIIFGDSGTGKSVFAASFAKMSCEKRNIKKIMLIDTEQGWGWLKINDNLKDINIIEPKIDNITKQNFLDLLSSIKTYIAKNEIACLIIDSASHVGELIQDHVLDNINSTKKENQKIEDLRFSDWGKVRNIQNNILDMLRNLKCDVLLCCRATSEKETKSTDYTADNGKTYQKQTIIDATNRTVKGWKTITYEFDFTILAEVEFNILEENIKKFNFLVLKSRIENDGEKIQNINHWFNLIEVIDFEKEKTKLLLSSNEVELKNQFTFIYNNKNSFTTEQFNELEKIKNNLKTELSKNTNENHIDNC